MSSGNAIDYTIAKNKIRRDLPRVKFTYGSDGRSVFRRESGGLLWKLLVRVQMMVMTFR